MGLGEDDEIVASKPNTAALLLNADLAVHHQIEKRSDGDTEGRGRLTGGEEFFSHDPSLSRLGPRPERPRPEYR